MTDVITDTVKHIRRYYRTMIRLFIS